MYLEEATPVAACMHHEAAPPDRPGGICALPQLENEYGFCGFNDKVYLQHLASTARASLGSEAVLFTTDPPNVVTMGGLYGDDVISCAHSALHARHWALP
jgi:beta-galactosidase